MKEYFPFVNRCSDLLSIDPVRQGFKFNFVSIISVNSLVN